MSYGRSQVTRFVNGINNVADNSIMADFGMPDPTKWHVFFDDFVHYNATDWTITTTELGAGSATEALTDINGGALLVTNDNANADNDFFNKVGESFLLASGKRAFFKTRLKLGDATATDLVVGLQITDTTPLDVTDGIYFLKPTAAATVDFYCRKDATTGSNSTTGIATMANDTFIELAWFYDGESTVYYAVDGVVKGSLDASATYLPDTELTVSFGIQNGAAAAKTLTLDYLFAAIER